jgi:galactitol-specific phosphotransferase system IIC component
MISKSTQITTILIVIAIIFAYAADEFTKNGVLPIAVLIGVGVILPMLINQWRTSENRA